MIALVTGGARSGKSAYAEELALSLGKRRWYLATMRPDDAENRARIARHLEKRAGKGFATIEVFDAFPRICGGVALLEDLPNLLSARLYGPGYALEDPDETCETIVEELRGLSGQCDSLVVVTNEVGCDGVSYPHETQAYVDALGRLGCEVAAFADHVFEVVCGQPIEVK